MKADEPALVPGLQALGKVRIGRRLRDQRDEHGQRDQTAKMKPVAIAATDVSVRQVNACCGPKLSAVDKVVAASAIAVAPSASIQRRQPGRDTTNASRQGASRPNAIAMNSLPGGNGDAASASDCSQGWVHPAAPVPSTESANASRKRGQIWPTPSGTGAGNSKPTGHSTSNVNPPALRSMNQRSRTICQRANPPCV